MKTKKYLIALAIIGGVCFTVQATNLYDLNEEFSKTSVPKDIKKPRNG